ncbi:MAG: hypothetical protein IJ747_05565 [Lachnospiraceae bacterium]|nr:hypothetical protein [Lachnospiraceae bacterium]
MTVLFELQQEQSVILFNRGKQLVIQYREADRIGRPFLLAEDYAGKFHGVVYQGTVYYSYQNSRGDFLFKNMRDATVYYQLRADEAARGIAAAETATPPNYGDIPYLAPYLHAGKLFLLHGGMRADGNVAFLEEIQMFNGPSRVLAETLPVPCHILLWPSSGRMFVSANTPEGDRYYCTDEQMHMIPLYENKPDTVPRKERDAVFSQLAEKEAEIARLRKMIESASDQYSDLMHVAEQYRDEAVKWRSKFTF